MMTPMGRLASPSSSSSSARSVAARSATSTDSNRTLAAIELGRVCVWATDLGLEADHAALEADIDELIDSGRYNPNAPGDQTLSELHLLNGDHWHRFFCAVRDCIRELLLGAPTRYDEGTIHLRAWATRVTPTGDSRGLGYRPQDLHNHAPAFFSGVYFVRGAGEASEGNRAGTYFANPFPHSVVAPAPGIVVPGREGRLILFPSWLLHGPRLTPESTRSHKRVLIAFDAHLIPH